MPFRLDYRNYRKNENLRKYKRVLQPIRFCPTPGCYGWGNTQHNRLWHYSRHSCPLNDANIMTVRVGHKHKDSKLTEMPIDLNETPIFRDKQKGWHYFIIIGGEGSAELKVYKDFNVNNQVNEDVSTQDVIDIEGEIDDEMVFTQEIKDDSTREDMSNRVVAEDTREEISDRVVLEEVSNEQSIEGVDEELAIEGDFDEEFYKTFYENNEPLNHQNEC